MYGSKKGAYYADASKNMDESKWDLNAAKKDYIITQPYNFSKNYNMDSIYIRHSGVMFRFHNIFRIPCQEL